MIQRSSQAGSPPVEESAVTEGGHLHCPLDPSSPAGTSAAGSASTVAQTRPRSCTPCWPLPFCTDAERLCEGS